MFVLYVRTMKCSITLWMLFIHIYSQSFKALKKSHVWKHMHCITSSCIIYPFLPRCMQFFGIQASGALGPCRIIIHPWHNNTSTSWAADTLELFRETELSCLQKQISVFDQGIWYADIDHLTWRWCSASNMRIYSAF